MAISINSEKNVKQWGKFVPIVGVKTIYQQCAGLLSAKQAVIRVWYEAAQTNNGVEAEVSGFISTIVYLTTPV